MNQINSFDVVVRKKIPYLTSFLFTVLVIISIILLIVYLFFLPSENQPLEMRTAYFILVVPEFIKKALALSGIGFVVALILYINVRFYRQGQMICKADYIAITGKRLDIQIPIEA